MRKYGRLVQYSKNSLDLHNVRKDRFGHLPGWGNLSEETKHHILALEEHKAKEHKEWEEWRSENNPKHARPDAVTLPGDRSGLKQMMMFKGKRYSGIYLLRKGQMAFNFGAHDHHVAYTRTSASGAVSNIKAKGTKIYHAGADIPTHKLNADTYWTHDKEVAEKGYLNSRPGETGKLHEAEFHGDKPAGDDIVIKVAKKLGFDTDEIEMYTPATIFDKNVFPAKLVDKLKAELTKQGYSHIEATDITPPGEYQKEFKAIIPLHPLRKSLSLTHLLRKSNKNHGEHGHFAAHNIDSDIHDFERVLEAVKTDQLDMRRPARVMRHTPAILQQLGAKNREIDIDPNDIKKIILSWRQDGGKHGIPADIAKNIPKWLSNPIMVFDSNTQRNSLVILTEAEHENEPIYVMIHLEKDRGRKHYVNRVASTYNRPDSDVERWVKAGLLRCYDEKKGSDWLRARGLQLPTAGTSLQSLSKKTILLKSQNVNYIIINKSLSSQPAIPALPTGFNSGSDRGEQLSSRSAIVIREEMLLGDSRKELLKGFGTSSTSRATIDIASHNTLQKSESPAESTKPASQNDALVKPHHCTRNTCPKCGGIDTCRCASFVRHGQPKEETTNLCYYCREEVRPQDKSYFDPASPDYVGLKTDDFQKSILAAATDILKTGKSSVIL